MAYSSLKECIEDLERAGMLVRIPGEVDPGLEMAAIHRRVFQAGGPAVFYERVKGSPFPAVSNLFGTLERARYIFRHHLEDVKKLIELKAHPEKFLKNPFRYLKLPLTALHALPARAVFHKPVLKHKTTLSALPQIKCWQKDGGAFITLPQVYTEDQSSPGIMHSNIGMYRIQISGNAYIQDKEAGLHYQIHRGIGVHQTIANELNQPLRVSIFVGGPPAHTLAAVMPLPEGIPEVSFAGALNGRRFRYAREKGYTISCDADFVITGMVRPGKLKPEGPFGDHLGYYSLQHDFPVLDVDAVYHRSGAIYPFTVVGRPPQEDTVFGKLIHELVEPMVGVTIPGVHAVHAVDAAGVHPLLLAIGSERYTPYSQPEYPQELLTQANHILGFGQMSLAKYLLIACKSDNPELNVEDEEAFFHHIFERIDLTRDLHFQTRTTIDTLDYSGTALNQGSKLVMAAVGKPRRQLARELSPVPYPAGFGNPRIVSRGILAVQSPPYTSQEQGEKTAEAFCNQMAQYKVELSGFPLIILVDDSDFTANSFENFLWVTFTRSNPSHDVYGIDAFIDHKHWGCRGSMVIDARIKPHHAPPLEENPEVERRVDQLGAKGGPLYGII